MSASHPSEIQLCALLPADHAYLGAAGQRLERFGEIYRVVWRDISTMKQDREFSSYFEAKRFLRELEQSLHILSPGDIEQLQCGVDFPLDDVEAIDRAINQVWGWTA